MAFVKIDLATSMNTAGGTYVRVNTTKTSYGTLQLRANLPKKTFRKLQAMIENRDTGRADIYVNNESVKPQIAIVTCGKQRKFSIFSGGAALVTLNGVPQLSRDFIYSLAIPATLETIDGRPAIVFDIPETAQVEAARSVLRPAANRLRANGVVRRALAAPVSVEPNA